jgi:hypothetical protein
MDQPKLKGYFELVRDLQKTLKSFKKTHTSSVISETKLPKTVKKMDLSEDNNVYYFGQMTSLKNLK